MRKVWLCAVLATMYVSCKEAQKPKEQPEPMLDQITEEEALDLLHEWTAAYLAGDADALDGVLDETWIYSGSEDGSTSDKAATIKEFSNADYTFSEITYDNVEVRLYGDIAVVRGSEKMVIVGGSGEDTTRLGLRFTDVYQKSEGKVKAIATHSSPIMEAE